MLKTLLSKLSNWKDVVAFYTIRLALAPVVETAILLDRMFYLQEQGWYIFIHYVSHFLSSFVKNVSLT